MFGIFSVKLHYENMFYVNCCEFGGIKKKKTNTKVKIYRENFNCFLESVCFLLSFVWRLYFKEGIYDLSA